MRNWRQIPLQNKATLAMFLISICVMFIALSAMLVFQMVTLRTSFERDFETLARIMAANSSAAVALDDKAAAANILSSLREKRFFNRAWIEVPGRGVFVEIQTNRPSDLRSTVRLLRQSAPVFAGTERIAILWVEGDFEGARAEMVSFFIQLATGVVIVCAIVGWLLASRAQQILLRPVLTIASAAERVIRDRDLSLRVKRSSDDEIGLLASRFNEMLSQIETQDRQLKNARSDLESKVIALEFEIAERRRIEAGLAEVTQREESRLANDLHDGLGQMLTGIAFKAHLLRTLLEKSDPRHSKLAAEVVELANESIKQARDIAHGVAPVALGGAGLAHSLEQLGAQVEQLMGARCTVKVPEKTLKMPLRTSIELYRISQEAMHNAARHGGATEIEILLEERNAIWRLEIRDNGRGLPPEELRGHGLGLKLMAHRAGSIGGTIAYVSNPSGGLTVRCAVPIAGEDDRSVAPQGPRGH